MILCVSWALFVSTTHGIQSFYQTQLLLQLRKHLEYPKALASLENYNGDLCNLSSTPNMSIICQNDSVTELKIIGDMLGKVSEFNGFAIPNKTLSASFSVDSFVTTLTRLTNLKVLCLVSLGIWGTLPDKIHRLNSLELLDLSSNFMFGAVPSELSRLTKLNSLTLDGNYFNGTVPDWLDSFSSLTILSLKSNRFTGPFPSSVSKISSLNAVALSHNQLTGKLPDLSSLKRLHVLDLRENKFDSGLPGMPKGLVTVLLSYNSFSGKIPEPFGRLSQLQHLDLSLNHLSGIPPAALFSLPNISYLNLSSNVLSGRLPDHLKCGSKLGVVDISENKLIGAIPSCLDGKSGKREVKFGGNCFSLDVQNQHQESYCEEANVERKYSKCREIGVLVAVIFGAVVVLGLLALGVLFLCRKVRSKKTYEHNIIAKVVQDSAPTGVSSDVLASASKLHLL